MVSVFVALAALVSVPAFAAKHSYQVTGPVVEVSDTAIVVKKGSDNWEIAREAGTQVEGGELAVGDKVTVEYTMAATHIAVKQAKKKKK